MENIPELEEVSNIQNMPDSYIRKLFSSKDLNLVKRIKMMGYEICRTKISEAYIKRSLNNFKHGYVYYKGTQIIGFAVWKEKTDIPTNMNKGDNKPPIPYMELLLICTQPNDYQIAPNKSLSLSFHIHVLALLR